MRGTRSAPSGLFGEGVKIGSLTTKLAACIALPKFVYVFIMLLIDFTINFD